MNRQIQVVISNSKLPTTFFFIIYRIQNCRSVFKNNIRSSQLWLSYFLHQIYDKRARRRRFHGFKSMNHFECFIVRVHFIEIKRDLRNFIQTCWKTWTKSCGSPNIKFDEPYLLRLSTSKNFTTTKWTQHLRILFDMLLHPITRK